jgi:hypothetical protein
LVDFWLVWEYAAILLSVLSGLKDPLLCLPPPPCATPPFSGEKRVALHEHSAAHSRGVSMYDGGGSWRGGDGGGAHQARKAKFVL